jgi:hypothetical protein
VVAVRAGLTQKPQKKQPKPQKDIQFFSQDVFCGFGCLFCGFCVKNDQFCHGAPKKPRPERKTAPQGAVSRFTEPDQRVEL